MLATIWSEIDALLPKRKEEKLVNTNFCRECSSVKIFSPEGLPVCSNCGLVDDNFIDEAPEWTSGITDDGKVNDPRDVEPNPNPELFSQNWGREPSYLQRVILLTRINGWLKLTFICR